MKLHTIASQITLFANFFSLSFLAVSFSVEPDQTASSISKTVFELKSKFSGYANLYYTEIFDLLQSTDFEINETNLNTNLMKFMKVLEVLD